MVPKPVERRYLWSPASLAPQGKLEMWVEVLTPQQALASKPKVLRAPMALECQLQERLRGTTTISEPPTHSSRTATLTPAVSSSGDRVPSR